MNLAAFLASLGWVNISSQHILSNAAFLLASSHMLFLFSVHIRHSISRCCADCDPRLQGHSSESKAGNFLECRNFLRPIFSVLTGTIITLATLQRPLSILSIFFMGSGQIVRSSLPVFSLDQVIYHNSEVFCSSASLMVAGDLPSSCSFAL